MSMLPETTRLLQQWNHFLIPSGCWPHPSLHLVFTDSNDYLTVIVLRILKSSFLLYSQTQLNTALIVSLLR